MRVWIATGALFLALLPVLPLGIAQLQTETCGCDMKRSSACQKMCARQSHAPDSNRLSQVGGDCSIDGCSMRPRPRPDGAPSEGSTVRQAVTPKAAPGEGHLVVPARTAASSLNAAVAALPPTPWIEIQVPPPRPLRLA